MARRHHRRYEVRVNDMIRISPIRVIDEDGNQIGIMSNDEALAMARERGLDLVEIAPKAKPPVCKIIDYGKYKYEKNKKAKRAKKKQHVTHLKEIKLSTKIEEHDINFKMKHAENFLKDRDKVKFTIKFRGREMQHQEIGYELLDDIKERFKDISFVEKEPQRMGNTLSMTLVGKPGQDNEESDGGSDAEDQDE